MSDYDPPRDLDQPVEGDGKFDRPMSNDKMLGYSTGGDVREARVVVDLGRNVFVTIEVNR